MSDLSDYLIWLCNLKKIVIYSLFSFVILKFSWFDLLNRCKCFAIVLKVRCECPLILLIIEGGEV